MWSKKALAQLDKWFPFCGPCGFCGKHNATDGHDGCLGTLPDVMNACCGHGEPEHAFVQFNDGVCVRGQAAIVFFNNLGERRARERT